MQTSILLSVKQIVGLMPEDDPFNNDVLIHLNAALAILYDLGVFTEPVTVVDSAKKWSDLGIPPEQLNLVQSYISLKVQSLFDPPTLSFLITARNEQLAEMEWRLNVMREQAVLAAEEEAG